MRAGAAAVSSLMLLSIGCAAAPPDPSQDATFAQDAADVVSNQPSDPLLHEKIRELVDDADGAVQAVDAFWAEHWAEFFTGSYTAPAVSGGYFGSDNPSCGDEHQPMPGNAYYCQADDYIAWDWDLLTSQYGDEHIGDSFVYYLIAHEWAHAIQSRLDQSIVSVAAELQADCIAAATLDGAAKNGTLELEPGDRGEIFQSLAHVADEYEWGDPRDHGTADERIEAYQLGEKGGVNACLVGSEPTSSGSDPPASLESVLLGMQWHGESEALGGQDILLQFNAGGQFSGQLIGQAYAAQPQEIAGTWQVAGPILHLDYTFNLHVDNPEQTVSTPAQIQIHMTEVSPSKLVGRDSFNRVWQWQRVG